MIKTGTVFKIDAPGYGRCVVVEPAPPISGHDVWRCRRDNDKMVFLMSGKAIEEYAINKGKTLGDKNGN